MKKHIRILTFILALTLAAAYLSSCSLFGDMFGGTAGAVLPDVAGEKTELTKESAVELYDEIMSYGSGAGIPNYKSVMDKVIKSNAFSTPATAEAYLNYVAQCERSSFENGGSVSLGDGTSATLMYGANDGEILLIVHRDGKMYVILLEVEIPPEERAQWPSDEDFARYHIKLTQASGTHLISAVITTKETDTFCRVESLYVDMKDATRTHYLDYIKAVKDAGYVLEPHGDIWDGQENYIAYKTVGKTAFGCEVRLIDGNRVFLDFWNETQKIQIDRGVLISDLWERGTFVIKSEYMYTPPEGDMKPDGAGGKEPDTEPYLRTDYMALSFSPSLYAEFWDGDREGFSDDRYKDKSFMFRECGSEIYDYANYKIYYVTNYGLSKRLDEEYADGSGEDMKERFRYSVECHVSSRGTLIGCHWASATNIKKTGKTNIIAGIECAEYTATCVATDGDNKISWDAVFNVWEEYGIALSYRGREGWDREGDYYEEYLLITEDCWAEDALSLPFYGEYVKDFPSEKIEADLGFALPEVEGASGYFVEILNRSPDGNYDENYLRNAYHVGGLTRAEYLAYRCELEKLGFRLDDEWVSPYMYRESDNAKITLSMQYDKEKSEMVFEVVIEKTRKVTLPDAGEYSIRYTAPFDEEVTITFTFSADGDVSFADSRGYEGIYEKIGNFTYRYSGKILNVIHLFDDIGSSCGIITSYSDDWGFKKTGTDTVMGIETDIYESHDGVIKVLAMKDSGFILKRTDSGKVTVELTSVG